MKLKIHKPDLKGGLKKIKNLKREDVKAWWKNRKERRARILEERKNSEFAKKMKPVYAFMNRFSLVFHALLACVINFAIEAISRHSVIAAGEYMIGTPLVFLYNAFMIFITFSVVYFFKRRIFVRIIIGPVGHKLPAVLCDVVTHVLDGGVEVALLPAAVEVPDVVAEVVFLLDATKVRRDLELVTHTEGSRREAEKDAAAVVPD